MRFTQKLAVLECCSRHCRRTGRRGIRRRLSGAADRIDRAVGPGRRRRPARAPRQQADGADARPGHPGDQRAGRHRRDRHGEASVRARRRLLDGDLHRRQPRAARRQEPALDHERHHAGRGDDQGAVVHLREAGQPIQDLGRLRQGSQGQSRQAEDRDARLRQRRRFLARPCSIAAASRSCRCRSPSRASATSRSSAATPTRSTSRRATSPSSSTASRCGRSCCSAKSVSPRSRTSRPPTSSATRSRCRSSAPSSCGRHAAGRRQEAVGRAGQGLRLGRIQEIPGGAVRRSEQLRGCRRKRRLSSTSSSKT